ncbi:N-acetylmuramoyl-L-alanine amidase [Anaerosalibacter bizertensis]|uniref:N-acetylmuramoyl-L-alanine amidase n=1 Tax=Anaerosalibacter bizertensis TaxID=932217 RepID=A0A844FGM2_9FIRM|nr:peptidoglycan-binding protein [Anaerosalibacter bizertensis]MSS43177.1 N-acetylmuramoyl-L-alanine amidase [Anaerosalibacter bizertensis]
MEIIKNLVPASKYNIKCPYTMNAQFIVVHNTANDASAANEIAYMIRNNNQVSFHYAVDDVEVVQGIPENRNTWHAGDGGNGRGNRNGIAVEICYSRSGGDRFIKAEKNAAKFIASKLKEKGWGIDKVKKHQDFANKYCPHRTLDMGWNRFLNMIQSELNTSNSSGQNTSTVLKRGSRGTQVRYLQMNLSGLGYKGVSIDGIYGPGTESGVRRFQKAEGLNVDGIAGPNTLNRMDSNIKGIQNKLKSKGYYKGSIDGMFGPGTKSAVITFQKANRLVADGIPGKNTMAKLNEVIKPQPKPGKLYRVQTGAFSKRSNADNLVKELKKKGYDAIVVKQGNLYKVQTGAFSKRENADKLVAQLKKDGFEAFVI